MKKFLLRILFSFLVVVFMPLAAEAQSGINITVDPTTAKVGEKITITVEVIEAPAGSTKVVLYISDTVIGTPKGNEAHPKDSWTAPDPGNSASYRYTWDTKAALSNPGLHYINVFVTDAADYVKLSQTTTYTLAETEEIDNDGGTNGGGGTDGTKDEGTSATGIGDWGTIIFPSTKISSIRDLIVAIIDWLLVLAGSLAVIAIIYSGIMYITAGGDPAKAETAKKNLVWAVIGIVIIALALVIINTVVSVLQGRGG